MLLPGHPLKCSGHEYLDVVAAVRSHPEAVRQDPGHIGKTVVYQRNFGFVIV
jgi:hypothetical protein